MEELREQQTKKGDRQKVANNFFSIVFGKTRLTITGATKDWQQFIIIRDSVNGFNLTPPILLLNITIRSTLNISALKILQFRTQFAEMFFCYR